jgi:hypothetical protein
MTQDVYPGFWISDIRSPFLSILDPESKVIKCKKILDSEYGKIFLDPFQFSIRVRDQI